MNTNHTDAPSNSEQYKTIMETLMMCSNLCAEHAEERKTRHCFREADGAMGCLELIRIEMIKLKLKYESSL